MAAFAIFPNPAISEARAYSLRSLIIFSSMRLIVDGCMMQILLSKIRADGSLGCSFAQIPYQF